MIGDNWREDDGSRKKKIFGYCEECFGKILYGEDILDIHGTLYCEKCFQKMRKVAED